VLDETNSLQKDEIFVCISDRNNPSERKVITGTCIVFRNPCFHPGDVRVVTAVECQELEHLADVLVFPANGDRDLPSMCSRGNLDGDDFTVIWDVRLIPEKDFLPMEYQTAEPYTENEVTIDRIKNFFLRYIARDNLERIANAHVTHAVKSNVVVDATHENCLQLAQAHSEALNFSKTGVPAEFPEILRVDKYPDFMDNLGKPTDRSNTLLGILYRSTQIPSDGFNPPNGRRIDFDERLFVVGY